MAERTPPSGCGAGRGGAATETTERDVGGSAVGTPSGAGPGPARPAIDLRDEDHLADAYRAHAGELARFAVRHLRDHQAANDVVQETFVRAWRHAHRYDPAVAGLRVWLFSIARNVVVDHARRTGRRTTGTPTDPAVLGVHAEHGPDRRPEATADGFSDDLVTGWMLEQALATLSPEQRSAIIETHLRGRPHDEVAAEQAVAPGTLRSRIFYGLKNLRRYVDEQGVTL